MWKSTDISPNTSTANFARTMSNDFQHFGLDDEERFSDTPATPPRYAAALVTVIGGFTGTVLLLLACFVQSQYSNFSPLSFMLGFILPIGALLIGILAGFLYCIPARMLQYRPSPKVIGVILLAQVCAFFVGRYLEYVSFFRQFNKMSIILQDENGDPIPFKIPPPSFVKYYRHSIEESEWTEFDHGKQKDAYKLGFWGWGMELLALGAFVLTAVIGPSTLASYAFCDDCQRFMKTSRSISYPIRAPVPSLKKGDLAGEQAFQAEDTAAIGAAVAYLKNLVAFLETEPHPTANAVANWLDDNVLAHSYDNKQQMKIPNNMSITFSECPLCDNYQLLITVVQTLNIPKAKMMNAFALIRFYKGTFTINCVEVLEEIGKQMHG